MKFGSKVVVLRGSDGRREGTPGCSRQVKGILVSARGKQRCVRLTQDDPLATFDYCLHVDDIGWWSASAVTLDVAKTK